MDAVRNPTEWKALWDILPVAGSDPIAKSDFRAHFDSFM